MNSSIAQSTLVSTDALPQILNSVYGRSCSSQIERYREGLVQFWQRFGPGPAAIFRAPGRINLIGGHTDYNHGYVLPVALDRDIMLIARPRTDRCVRMSNVERDFLDEQFEIAATIPVASSDPWSNYIRGAAQIVAQLMPDTATGIDCLVCGEAPFGVPRGSGLSSSSALTVAAVLALAHFSGLRLRREDLVQYCSDAEWYVGTRGGIMDQFISLFASRSHALFLDCRPDTSGHYATQQVPLPEDYQIIIAESGVRHNNVRGEYNKRVAACRTGVGLLRSEWPQATHLRDLENVEWGLLEPKLPEEISVAESIAAGCEIAEIPGLEPNDVLDVRACCRHVWHENHRVVDAHRALQHGDMTEAGRLVFAAHASARDDYHTSFPEMETLIRTASAVSGVVGGRITGAGWGGCAVLVVRTDMVPLLVATLKEEFYAQHGYVPAIYPCQSGTAAGYVATVDSR